jgi:hypothetical protein
MSYDEAKDMKNEIVARLWFSFDSGKPTHSKDGSDGHLAKYYHYTFPMFKRICYNKGSSHVGPTFNRLGDTEEILDKFIR